MPLEIVPNLPQNDGEVMQPDLPDDVLVEPEELPEVIPELRDQFRQLANLLRGNKRIETELNAKGIKVEASEYNILRMTMLQDALGPLESSKARLDFEMSFHEAVRTEMNKAILTAK